MSVTSRSGQTDAVVQSSLIQFCPPSQWICCDIRVLDVSILGKFSVVMADPPWDIHMELPYGTLTDDEMRKLHIPVLQDDGFLFLWVTGRYLHQSDMSGIVCFYSTNQLPEEQCMLMDMQGLTEVNYMITSHKLLIFVYVDCCFD